MKKYFLCLSAGLVSLGTVEAVKEGAYTGLTLAYVDANGKIDDWNTMLTLGGPNIGTQKKGGIEVAVLGGYGTNLGQFYLATEGSVSYNSSKPWVATVADGLVQNWSNVPPALTTSGQTRFNYLPGYGIGISMRLGYALSQTMMGFVRLGINYSFGSISADSNTPALSTVLRNAGIAACKALSLTPAIGIESALTQNVSWIGEVGYRKTISAPIEQFWGGWKDKPKAFIAKIGVLYRF